MDPRGEFAHSIRNPLAAADANIRFLKDVCRDLERAIEASGDTALWRELDPQRLIREVHEALGDSAQALRKIRDLLSAWVESADSR